MRQILIAAMLLGTTGCTSFSPPSRITQLRPNTQYWASYDASRRGAWISVGPTGQTVASCSEPAPDVALSLATTLKAKGSSGAGPSGEAELSATATAVALAGRDNVVLLAREALFRICEQAAAGKITAEQIPMLFKDVFEKTKDIAVAQAKKSADDTRRVSLQFQALKAGQPLIDP